MSSQYGPSSARRARRRSFVLPLAVAAVALGAAVAVRTGSRPETSAPAPAASPSPYHAAAATHPVASTAGPSPTTTPPSTVSTGWVEVPVPTATAPPQAPPLPTPAPPQRAPSPTPGISSCVSYEASGASSPAAWGQVLVEIEAYNGCRRDLEPLEVWFEVQGWREGALIQTARGHLFAELRRGRHERTTIALPGSASWYDRIVVLPLEPQTP